MIQNKVNNNMNLSLIKSLIIEKQFKEHTYSKIVMLTNQVKIKKEEINFLTKITIFKFKIKGSSLINSQILMVQLFKQVKARAN